MERYQLEFFFKSVDVPKGYTIANSLVVPCKTQQEVKKQIQELNDDSVHHYNVWDNFKKQPVSL